MSPSLLKKLENPAQKHPQAYFPSYRAGSQDTVLSQTIGKGGLTATVITGVVAGLIYIAPAPSAQPAKDKPASPTDITKSNPPKSPGTERPNSTTAIAPSSRIQETLVEPGPRITVPAPVRVAAATPPPSAPQVSEPARPMPANRQEAVPTPAMQKGPIAEAVVDSKTKPWKLAQPPHPQQCKPVNGHSLCWAVDDTFKIKPFTVAKQEGLVATAVEQKMAYQHPTPEVGDIAIVEESVDADRLLLAKRPQSAQVQLVRHSQPAQEDDRAAQPKPVAALAQPRMVETTIAIKTAEIEVQISRTEQEKVLEASHPQRVQMEEDTVLNSLPVSAVTPVVAAPVEPPNIQRAIVTEDQQYLVSLNRAKAVKVWAHQTGDLRYELPSQSSAFVDIHLQNTARSKGQTLMTTTEDGNQQAWHLASGEPISENMTEFDQALIN
jgi:hypothetical protein